MERVETRVRIRGGKWTTRLAFFSFHPSRLFVSGKLSGETRRYPSNRLRSQPFSSNAPFALRATTLPKLNQEIPFAFRLAYGVSHRGKWKQEEDRTTAEGKSFVLLRRRALCCQAYYICSTAFEMYQLFVLQR